MATKSIKPNTEVQDITSRPFKTAFNGFKKSDVNLYINTLIKKINSLEDEKNTLLSRLRDYTSSEGHTGNAPLNNYERIIGELREEIETGKQQCALLEKECERLSLELESRPDDVQNEYQETDLSNIVEDENVEIITDFNELTVDAEAETDFLIASDPENADIGEDLVAESFMDTEDFKELTISPEPETPKEEEKPKAYEDDMSISMGDDFSELLI